MTAVRGMAPGNNPESSRQARWVKRLLLAIGLSLLVVALALFDGRERSLLLVIVGVLTVSWLVGAFARGAREQARLLQRLEQAQELAVLGTWRWRVDSPTIEWGGESARIYGFPVDTVVVPLEEVMRRMHPDDVGLVARWMERARSADPRELVGLSVEYRVVRDDGSVRWVLGKVEADDPEGARTLVGVQQDITPQVIDRERLRLAQEIARLGDWEWDVGSGRIRWSDTMYSIYGLDPATYEPDADNVFGLIHHDDRDALRTFASNLAETGERCETEFRIVRPDGEVRTLRCIGSREIAPGGGTIIRSIQQDVTELALARNRLVETEEQYRFLFEHNPVPMWVFDRQSLAFLAVNDAMARHYGYTRGEILGRSMLDIRPPQDRDAVEAAARLQSVDRPQGRVWTHMRKDGTRLRAAVYTHDILFDERPARLVAAQDVTEREASEQRFQLVARATSDAIYDLDIPAGTLWWSDTMYAVFGYTREEVAPTVGAWEDMIHPDDRPQIRSSLYGALKNPRLDQLEMEYRLRRGDGTYALVVDRGFFVREDGMVVRMVGSVLDVTEKRKQDADLRLLRRAVEATESGVLIADVRAPGIPAVYVNQGFLAMTGYRADEVLGKDSRLLDFDPRDVDKIRQIRRAIAGHAELRTLVRMRRKDGGEFWNDFYMAPVLDEAGTITHMVSVSTDVSERQRSEERFQLVARATSDAVWDWDIARDETWRSDNVYPLFGYAPGEIVGSMTGWSGLLHPEDRLVVQTAVSEAIASDEDGWECEYRLRRKDGTYADVVDRGFLLRDVDGRAYRAVGGMIDVTQKRLDEADLRLLRRAVESTDNGILIADVRHPDQPLVYANPAFEHMTGYAAAEVMGRNCRFLQGSDQDQAALQTLRLAIAERRESRVVLRNYRKDGSLFWNELHVAPVHAEDGSVSHFVGILTDVSHRHHYEQELAHRATHDQLTGLPNRQLIMDRLQQAIRNADRYGRHACVLFIDLDDFKLINDNLDHAAGDEALRIVAARLRTLVRDTDTVGRFGGDEFVVVLTEQTDQAGVNQVIARISKALSVPMEIAGMSHTITPSIGWCRYPDGGSDADSLLKHADMAMYQAKRQGRNRAIAYDPGFDAQVSQRMQLVAQLRDALERDEFELMFQPLFDTQGRPVALEGLVRWRHPERGLLPPSEFIGVCEESGLIIELGRSVLHQAARHHAHLAAAGFPNVRIAVNVSALQFGYAFEDDVAAIVRQYQLPPGVLELEITESVILENPERAIEAMQHIAALGVCLAVDDFGTGYSSLAYLRRLPIDRLKIDRSFVEDLPDDREAASICHSIIGMAHALQLQTVGEGVETDAQLQWLRANGCDEVQGYLLARPAPFSEILARLSLGGPAASA
ncbi:sensor domain-containing protein [Thermomonas carbonis]|uniref:PAS domain-containing protein n=1 Tax=Thermomonas carbonis TaxID=1463158 RepID=A0A7G9SSL0_9GAMM|nr:PAS domain-containing protein [Thermomonas carbonis]QNN70835.1 PAS domain-containing protein [Thermomonas carbonis]GHC02740.1 hypothetical protein GCM10010080_15830 [Thermomonas carbonis]